MTSYLFHFLFCFFFPMFTNFILVSGKSVCTRNNLHGLVNFYDNLKIFSSQSNDYRQTPCSLVCPMLSAWPPRWLIMCWRSTPSSHHILKALQPRLKWFTPSASTPSELEARASHMLILGMVFVQASFNMADKNSGQLELALRATKPEQMLFDQQLVE